ncbi:uncharacterized protein DS421_20g689950 [Arachis hypogaea]|nr:uncharacterized protein DS421_20g689950 [Arachis hypogaea]
MHSNNSSSAEKSFRIKHDERFFSKLMAKEEGSSSRIFYYGEKSVASVPFTWEAQPGTPKHPLSDSSLLPPLTPPPSFYSNNTPTSGKKKRRSYYSSKRVNDVISTIWLRLSSSIFWMKLRDLSKSQIQRLKKDYRCCWILTSLHSK